MRDPAGEVKNPSRNLPLSLALGTVVVKTDSARPRSPSVLVLVDPNGKKIPEPTVVQVAEAGGLTITGVLTAEEAQQVRETT